MASLQRFQVSHVSNYSAWGRIMLASLSCSRCAMLLPQCVLSKIHFSLSFYLASGHLSRHRALAWCPPTYLTLILFKVWYTSCGENEFKLMLTNSSEISAGTPSRTISQTQLDFSIDFQPKIFKLDHVPIVDLAVSRQLDVVILPLGFSVYFVSAFVSASP